MPDVSDPNSVRITLEALNIAQKEIARATADLERLNAVNTSLTATTKTQTQAAAQSAAAINTVGTASENAGRKVDFFAGGMSRNNAAMKLARGSAAALNPLILTLGFSSFPKLTTAVFGATQALEGFHRAGVATAATLARVAGVAAAAAGAIAIFWTGMQSVFATNKASDIQGTLDELSRQQMPAVRNAMEEMRDSGRLTGEEFQRLNTILGDGGDFKTLSLVRQRLLQVGDALNSVEGRSRSLGMFQTKLAMIDAQPNFSGPERIRILGEISKEYEKQITFLQQQTVANINAAKTEAAKGEAVKKNIPIIEEINKMAVDQLETDKKIAEEKIRIQQEVGSSIATTFGAAAEAAKLFGRKGFLAWKAFALAQAIINGALAVSNELAQGDIYSKVFRAIAVGALAAVQIATIAAAQPAGFAEGGLIPGPPSHADNRMARVATGEYIFDTRSVQMMGPEWFGSLHAAIRAGNLESLPELSGFNPKIVVSSAAMGGLVGPTPTIPQSQSISVAMVNTRQQFRDFLLSKEGSRAVIDAANRRGNRLRG